MTEQAGAGRTPARLGDWTRRLLLAAEELSAPILNVEHRFTPRMNSRISKERLGSAGIAIGDTAWGCVVNAWDHLHAFRELVVQAGSVHSRAPLTLLRMAAESLAVAIWLLEPSDKKTRRRRHVEHVSAALVDSGRVLTKIDPAITSAKLWALIDEAATDLQLDIVKLRKGSGAASTAQVLRDLEHMVFGEFRSVIWNVTSSVSHGNMLVIRSVSQVERERGARPGAQYESLTLDEDLLELVALVLVYDLAWVLIYLSKYGAEWGGWRPDAIADLAELAAVELRRRPAPFDVPRTPEQAAAAERLAAAAVEALLETPRRRFDEIPARGGPGLYAWFAEPGCLDHQWMEGVEPIDYSKPVYVGIAEASVSQRATRDHLHRTRTSTLRQSLASLLYAKLRLVPEAEVERSHVRLAPKADERLTKWMRTNLRVATVSQASPKHLESLVVKLLDPPLNIEFRERRSSAVALKAARRALRARILEQDRLPSESRAPGNHRR